ncbi:MAG: rod shape-determining protein MreD [Gemmatimonadales bacterium]
MMSARAARTRLLLVMAFLLTLHFYVRPRLLDVRLAPDFLLIALLVYSIRSRPGNAAIAGFLVGIIGDALVPARFGAGALAHTVVGYLTAWGRAVFFADNLIVNAAVFAGGLWLRDLIVLVASGTSGDGLMSQLFIWSVLHALTTAIAGVIVLLLFRDWLEIRFEE